MKSVSFKRLRRTLLQIGFVEHALSHHARFIHPDGAQITLPKKSIISQGELRAVSRQISGFGLADPKEFLTMLE